MSPPPRGWQEGNPVPAVLDAISANRPGAVRRVRAVPGQSLLSPGALRRDLWLVETGLLRMQHTDRDGRRQILHLVFPGEIVGINPRDLIGTAIEACGHSTLHRIDRRAFDEALTRDPGFRRRLLRHQEGRLEQVRFLTWLLRALRPAERVCAFVAFSLQVMPARRLGDGSLVLDQIMPRTDIADLLRTSVETISRVTRALQRKGVIEIEAPSRFRIIDLPRLKRMGGIAA